MTRLTVIDGGAPCADDPKPADTEDALAARMKAAAAGERFPPDTAEDLREQFNTGLRVLAMNFAWFDERTGEYLGSVRHAIEHLNSLVDRFEALVKEGA